MTKKTILLFLTFFFTACVERGYTPKPINHSIAKPIVTKTIQSTISPKPLNIKTSLSPSTTKQESITLQENKIVQKEVTISKPSENIDESPNNIFSLTEETKNKISGFFILIIGLIILL